MGTIHYQGRGGVGRECGPTGHWSYCYTRLQKGNKLLGWGNFRCGTDWTVPKQHLVERKEYTNLKIVVSTIPMLQTLQSWLLYLQKKTLNSLQVIKLLSRKSNAYKLSDSNPTQNISNTKLFQLKPSSTVIFLDSTARIFPVTHNFPHSTR